MGLDYVFDRKEFDEYIRAHPEVFPRERGYDSGIAMIGPECFPHIAEALLQRGYSEGEMQGILRHNNLRLAQRVWR